MPQPSIPGAFTQSGPLQPLIRGKRISLSP